jgi:hypothetical protein
MPIRVTCPSCRAAAACPDEYRGRALRCKKCGRSFVAGARVPRPAMPRAAPAGKPARGRLLIVGLVAVLIGAAVGLPAAYFYAHRDKQPTGVAVGPAPADTGPAPPPVVTHKQEPPRDTGAKPPPVVKPIVWQDFTSRDWGFSVRFPGAPQAVSRPGVGGRRTQVFVAMVPLAPDGKQAQFTITCTDCDPRATADAATFLAAATAEFAGDAKEKSPLKLDGFPGVELRAEKKDADGPEVWLAARHVYLVRSCLYELYAGGPRDQGAATSFKPFFDSFTLLDVAPPPPPPPVQKPRERPATPPKGGVAELQLMVPGGWQANYNKFSQAWTVTKPPPTPRSDAEVMRIEECPADARTPADYAAHLKGKDFLFVDWPAWVEVGKVEALPDGFVIKGVVKKYGNPKTPPVLGLVVVREIGGLKVRCFSATLRGEKSRDEALEMLKGATFGAAK